MDKFEIIKSILELVEDEQFPAKRNITDYILLLLAQYENNETLGDIEKYINDYYGNIDARQEAERNVLE